MYELQYRCQQACFTDTGISLWTLTKPMCNCLRVCLNVCMCVCSAL